MRFLSHSFLIGLCGVVLWFSASLTAAGDAPRFGPRENLGIVVYDPINEASGLVASRRNPGVLWTHNDSGDSPRLFAMNTEGAHLGVYDIAGAEARDWEGIALGPGPREGVDYLYIADFGDNKGTYDVKTIYRLPEPRVSAEQDSLEVLLTGAEAILFRYPDGMRDAETLIVDPWTRDLYILSKREKRVKIYRAPYPQSTEEILTLELVGDLGLSNVTAGDLSPDGRELILKTYLEVYYWQREKGEELSAVFTRPGTRLPYLPEPQGEAIAWDPKNLGYYTLSEEKDKIPAFLYFYPRLESTGASD